jgi:hypothetical protein
MRKFLECGMRRGVEKCRYYQPSHLSSNIKIYTHHEILRIKPVEPNKRYGKKQLPPL